MLNTAQEYFTKAREIVEAVHRNPGMAGEPDITALIAYALVTAFARGYADGVEAGAKVCEDYRNDGLADTIRCLKTDLEFMRRHV